MPLPYVKKVGQRTGRGTPAAEADWARAKAIVQKEYGDIPDDRRYAIVTKVFKNITKGHTSEGQIGGNRQSPPSLTAQIVLGEVAWQARTVRVARIWHFPARHLRSPVMGTTARRSDTSRRRRKEPRRSSQA